MPRRGALRSLGPVGLRSVAWGAAGVLLTGLFVVQGLPYERLSAAICAAVAQTTPFALQIQELGPSLSLLGPGVRATGVRLHAGGGELRVDALRLRPAWSLRWLLLRPTFRLAAEVAGGSLDGTLGAGPDFSGEAAELDLAQLPVATLWPGGALAGRLDANVDLRASATQGPEGSLSLAAREGSVTLPRLPLPLPFETLTGRLVLGGDAMLRVETLQLSGPGLTARVEGSLGQAAAFAQAPFDLRIEIEAEPALRAGLGSFGVRLGADGRGTLRVTGTPTRPVVE
jgi:type II secretion system protein N